MLAGKRPGQQQQQQQLHAQLVQPTELCRAAEDPAWLVGLWMGCVPDQRLLHEELLQLAALRSGVASCHLAVEHGADPVTAEGSPTAQICCCMHARSQQACAVYPSSPLNMW